MEYRKSGLAWHVHINQKSALLKPFSYFSLVWVLEFNIIPSCYSLLILVCVQRLLESGKLISFFNGAKWLNVRLQTKPLWNQFPLQLFKIKISCFIRARYSLTTECPFTLIRVFYTIRTQS